MSDQEGMSNDVDLLVDEASRVLEEMAGAVTWKDVIDACFRACAWPVRDECGIYDDSFSRELRLDVIGRVLLEASAVLGDRPVGQEFHQHLELDFEAVFESFGFEDAWHGTRND